MAVGAKYGVTVGEAEAVHTSETRELIMEMAQVAESVCYLLYHYYGIIDHIDICI